MSSGRIGLALGAFAAVAVSMAGSPLATADITDMAVHTTSGVGDVDTWNIDAYITCNPASTPVAPPVHFTDNGKALPGSPGTTGACVTVGGVSQTSSVIAFLPTTLGVHHIVATQYNPAGSVLSTIARDVNVTVLPSTPCPTTGSAAMQCKSTTGS
ncbi:hypothetical protein ACIRRA_19870 [Nocardia sp. NPDC101769]|uniref:hypothetical protein n=1 Tax=Nocardia sp. NPDC101769 TaxID=3364333 RepID=UPI00382F8D30